MDIESESEMQSKMKEANFFFLSGPLKQLFFYLVPVA